MSLPPGVMVDGYVAWDTAGVYNSLVVGQTLPLRFTADPSTLLLPAIQR